MGTGSSSSGSSSPSSSSCTTLLTFDHYAFQPPTPPTYSLNRPYPCRFILTRSRLRLPIHVFDMTAGSGGGGGGKRREASSFSCILIHSHGNAADLGTCFLGLSRLHEFLPEDILLISYDYVGYGLADSNRKPRSGKKRGVVVGPSERSAVESLRAVVEFCRKEYDIGPERIVLLGTSLGSGVAIEVCCGDIYNRGDTRFLGLWLQSPLLSVGQLVHERMKCAAGVVETVSGDIFQNSTKIVRVACPVFIIHGMADQTVPVSHGQRLYDLVPSCFQYRFKTVDDAGHNDLLGYVGLRVYARWIQSFVDFCLEERIRPVVNRFSDNRGLSAQDLRDLQEASPSSMSSSLSSVSSSSASPLPPPRSPVLFDGEYVGGVPMEEVVDPGGEMLMSRRLRSGRPGTQSHDPDPVAAASEGPTASFRRRRLRTRWGVAPERDDDDMDERQQPGPRDGRTWRSLGDDSEVLAYRTRPDLEEEGGEEEVSRVFQVGTGRRRQ